MRRLVAKLFIFLMLLLALALPLAGLAWHSGEAMPVQLAVKLQQNAPGVIFLTEGACGIMQYKLAAYQQRQPEILILGSSLMVFIRSGFFTENPVAVYNAAMNSADFEAVLEYSAGLDHHPKIIIALVKPEWFFADAAAVRSQRANSIAKSCGYEDFLRAMTRTAHYLLEEELTLAHLIERRDFVFGRASLGLSAIKKGYGYRADGSLLDGRLTASRELQDQRRTDALNRRLSEIEEAGYAGGARLSEPALDKLDAFLAGWRQKGVTVVGLSTPVHFEIHERMAELGGYNILDAAARRIEAIFEDYGFSYHFINDLRAYGITDKDWLDFAHLTESGSLRLMFRLFLQHQDLFARYTDISKVISLLAKTTNPMDVLRESTP